LPLLSFTLLVAIHQAKKKASSAEKKYQDVALKLSSAESELEASAQLLKEARSCGTLLCIKPWFWH